MITRSRRTPVIYSSPIPASVTPLSVPRLLDRVRYSDTEPVLSNVEGTLPPP
ncbi:MAG: hypothetical protein QOC70_221 [Verrucomicrobiota bacterium]